MRNRYWWDARRIREEEDTEERIELAEEERREQRARARRQHVYPLLGIHDHEAPIASLNEREENQW